jgi:uncharacterized cupin superfamily protein
MPYVYFLQRGLAIVSCDDEEPTMVKAGHMLTLAAGHSYKWDIVQDVLGNVSP